MSGLQHGIEEEPGVLQCRRELDGAVAPDSWKNCGIDLCGRLDQDATELVLSDNAAAQWLRRVAGFSEQAVLGRISLRDGSGQGGGDSRARIRRLG
jgi:hypothetical protein